MVELFCVLDTDRQLARAVCSVRLGVKPGAIEPGDEGKSFVPFSSQTAVVNFLTSTHTKESHAATSMKLLILKLTLNTRAADKCTC